MKQVPLTTKLHLKEKKIRRMMLDQASSQGGQVP